MLSLMLLMGLSMFNGQCSIAQAQNDAMYIYRNDGVINAFLKTEIDSIRHSPLDLDSLMHAENVVQEVWTADSVYRIPLAAIDSISFVTPPTVYKKDVTQLEYNLLEYIIGADGLVLKLKPDTPTMIVPLKGDKLVLLEGCEALPYGFSGIVADVQYGCSSIDVVCEQAYLEDLFDSFCSVSTVFGCNPDSIPSPSSRRRVTYNPDDVVFSLGPYRVNRSYEVSQGIAFDGDLALSGGTSFSVEVQPTFRIHTFLIMGKGQGTYFSYRITGNLRVTSQSSLYGGISYNHDFDGLIAQCPIPMTGNMVNFYINPGLFLRADATITSTIKSTQNYTFGSAFDFSSKGLNTIKPSIGGRLASSSVDMEGSLDGSLAGGGYIETGFNLLSREIANVCVRGEIGARFSGSFVLRNSYIENATKETKLYERLKASSVDLSSFVNVSLQASVAHTGNGLTWELSEPIHTWNLVPEFSNTKLTKTPGSNTSVDAYTELRGECLFPVNVGYKLLDDDKNEVKDYNASGRYTNRASKLEHTFTGLEESKLHNYKVYPKVKLFGYDILANPEAGLELLICPDDNHPHAIDLGLPSGTKWCCCNVGASTPEGYGGYYAWGETSEKSVYDWDTNKYYYDTGDESGYTKYCTSSVCGYNGFTDGKTELELNDDVARVRMGAPWRMPSYGQMEELINNCSHQWTTQNGVNGILVTGRNGGQIFLPAAGYRFYGSSLYSAGSRGLYWSSSLHPNLDTDAYDLYLNSGDWDWNTRFFVRDGGLSVRAVRP